MKIFKGSRSAIPSILIVVLVLLSSFTTNIAVDNGEAPTLNEVPTTPEIEAIISLEQPAKNAYYNMLDNFKNVYGSGNYPSEFAGAYLNDNKQLCILLTDNSLEMMALYAEYCECDDIVFSTALYSYNLLESTLDYALQNAPPNMTNAYIDVVNNVVKVGVSDLVTTFDQYALERIQLPIDIIYEEPAVAEIDIYGGSEVVGYTLGMCGSYNNYNNAVLLCGHGLTLGTKLKLASTNTEFATVIRHQFSDNGLYDYAIATINSGASVSLTNKVKNAVSYTTITSQASYVPLVGSTVCMYGKAGGFGVGEVTAMSSSMTYSNYNNATIRNLVKCSWTGTPAYGPGSSGGPVYAGHEFYGTYCGSNTTGGNFWYSPVYDTGFNVRTS